MPHISCFSYLDGLWDRKQVAGKMLDVASGIFSKQHIAFLCSSHLPFSPYIVLMFMWCIHTVILTQLGRNPILIYWRDQISIWLIILSIAFRAFTRCILTSLLVDEILLPRYVNFSTNFRGLTLKGEIAPSFHWIFFNCTFFYLSIIICYMRTSISDDNKLFAHCCLVSSIPNNSYTTTWFQLTLPS